MTAPCRERRVAEVSYAARGPIAEPEDYAYVHKYVPKLAGFYGASSIERIPVETDVMHTVREYKALSLKT